MQPFDSSIINNDNQDLINAAIVPESIPPQRRSKVD